MIFRAYWLLAFLSALVTWNASSSATKITSSSSKESKGEILDAGGETIDSENPSFDRMMSHKELVSRMIEMEKEMKRQNERIKFQDERIDKQDKKIILLETRIAAYNNHEESKYEGSSKDPHSKEVIPSAQNTKKGRLQRLSRRKRQSLTKNAPSQKARLCTHLYDQNNPDAVIPRGNFIGVPSNCYELRLIGHYLNAYYFVQQNDNIGLVFCNFSEPSEISKLNLDEVINIASLLATSTTSIPTTTSSARTTMTTNPTNPYSVHFFVQRRSPTSNLGVVNFEIEKLNMGGAMNLTTGIFTAPKNGVYHFNFAGMKNEPGNLYVELRRNAKETVAVAHTDGAFSAQVAFVATIRLQKGETIDLYKEKDGVLYDSSYYSYTSFTGSLILAE